jgi:endoglucanase
MPFTRASLFHSAFCRLLSILAVLLAAAVSLSAAADNAVTSAAPALQRGVNLSNWFTNSQSQTLVSRDFEQMKSAGFDHVRLPVNPELVGFSLSEAAEGRVLFDFSNVDGAVNMARDAGLTTILDIHPTEGFLTLIEQDPRAGASLVALWSSIADHYRGYPPGSIAFEILNEPHYAADPTKYGTMIADIVAAIRKITPDHIIIVDLPKGGGIDNLNGFTALADDKVRYAFHFYEPYVFTHQGLRAASSHGMSLRYFRNLPYPSSTVQPRVNYAPAAADVLDARKTLMDYVSPGWNAARLAARIKLAADWATANHTHVICTEFGVVKNWVSPAARYQWLTDARKALEAAGIGWTVWDYTDTFGITRLNGETVVEPIDGSIHLADPTQGTRDIEPEAAKALFER